jgi:hypothetical protein
VRKAEKKWHKERELKRSRDSNKTPPFLLYTLAGVSPNMKSMAKFISVSLKYSES